MSSTHTIKLGGVPEHFNLPIHQAIERGEFEQRSLNVEWTTFKGGTGQMTKALRNQEVDACILLTEGITKDIINGNPSKIISGYVNTPLIWGIHTGSNNPLTDVKAIYDQQYAISRFGSGSHLMAIVDATVHDRKIQSEQFSIIKNLDGALDSLSKQETDVFYWEKYTTKPFVDGGQLRRLGEFITPWPCFVVAATEQVLKEKPKSIIRMLRTIHDCCDRFMQSDKSISEVSARYNLKIEDVERWYRSTEWAIDSWVSPKMLSKVINNLNIANIIDQPHDTDKIIWQRD